MIKIGARSSILSKAQVQIVKTLLNEKLNLDSIFVPVKSLGDLDLSSPIKKIAKEGVFTSTLEKALLEDKIDIAVHSFKDLPIINPTGLEVSAILERHNPTDSLIIKKSCIHILNKENKDFMIKGRIGTSSARRKSQLLNLYNDITCLDIRGNVQTRLKLLERGQYDGIVMASAVFERVKIEITSEFIRVELPLELFPTAPAQGAICIQMKRDNPFYESFLKLNDELTAQAVLMEREILNTIGSGCQLPLGATIRKRENWELSFTIAPEFWFIDQKVSIIRIQHTSNDINECRKIIQKCIPYNFNNNLSNTSIENKKIILLGSTQSCTNLNINLHLLHAQSQIIDLQLFNENWDSKTLYTYEKEWLEANWIIITSKRSINALNSFMNKFPKTKLKFASIGKATTKELQKFEIPVHFQPTKANSETLCDELSDLLESSDKLIFLASKKAMKTIPDYFEKKHINLTYIPVYDSNFRDKTPSLTLITPVDYAIVFSPRYAEESIKRYGIDLAKSWICFGKNTKDKLQNLGIKRIIEAKSSIINDLIEVME